VAVAEYVSHSPALLLERSFAVAVMRAAGCQLVMTRALAGLAIELDFWSVLQVYEDPGLAFELESCSVLEVSEDPGP